MNIEQKEKIADKIREIARHAVSQVEELLNSNNLRLKEKYVTMMASNPFNGYVPMIDSDMALEAINKAMTKVNIQYMLYTVDEIKSAISIDKKNDLPVRRIIRKIDDVNRLKKKYSVSDEMIEAERKEILKEEENENGN